MKRALEIPALLLAAACFAQADNVLFHVPFDGDAVPSAKAAGTKIVQKGITEADYLPGLKGKALRIGADADGKNTKSVTWTAPGNILPAKGTLSFYFKILDWQNFRRQCQHLFLANGNRPPLVNLSPSADIHAVLFYEGSGKTSIRLQRGLAPDDAWHHWAAVWNEKQLKFYLDGKQVAVRDRNFVQPEKNWRELTAGALNWGEKYVKASNMLS